jgi:hypothetical protein
MTERHERHLFERRCGSTVEVAAARWSCGVVWPGQLQKCDTWREKLIPMAAGWLTPLLCRPSLHARYSQLQASLI